jgi:hypothetical protein
MIKFIKSLLNSQDPTSSKRFIGLTGALSLIIGMFIYHTDLFVQSVLILSLGALAITGAESIFKK